MPRQDPFARLRSDPQDPVATIPQAQARKRGRDWERLNPGCTYYIPASLVEQAKDVRTIIGALAQKHLATTSSVASALAGYSLAMVRKGKLKIEARPDARNTKMSVSWEEVQDGWTHEIAPVKIGRKNNSMRLTYRFSKDIDTQVKALAGDALFPGEVVIFLLRYALAALKAGRMQLRTDAVVVTQKVSSTW